MLGGGLVLATGITRAAIDELVNLVETGRISGTQAREVFAEMFASGKTAATIVQEKGIELLQIDETVTRRQSEQLKKLRTERSNDEVTRNLNALRQAAAGSANLMPFIYDAVKSYATLGEICDAMRDVFGIYQEVAIT